MKNKGVFMNKLFKNFGVLIFLTVIVFLAAGCSLIDEELPELPAPTGLTATVTGKIITLGWEAVKDATSYIVYGSFTSGGIFVYIGDVSYGTAFYVVSMDERGNIPLEPNTTYYFKVCAYGGKLSDEVSATTGTW